jgi:hypothetical protein
MSIVLYRRLLALAGAAAVLAVGVGLADLVRHERATASAPPPEFRPELPHVPPGPPDRLHIGIALGAFGDVAGGGAPPPQRPSDDAGEELAKLGEIVSAIVVYPPYDQIKPALVFRFKEPQDGSRFRTIRLGEALVEVKQEGMGELRRPFRFKFIGFEKNPKDPDAPLFLFDVDCDGKNIQKLHWIGDEPKKQPRPVPGTDEDEQPNRPAVKLFERDEKGVREPTAEGHAYVLRYWKRFPAEVRTQPHVDAKSGKHEGVRILGIKPGSMVLQFGLVADDVIVAINGRPVSHKAETIRVIREEVHKKKTRIVVKLRRQGRVLEEVYDTRDPATRGKANRRNAEAQKSD